MRLPFFLTAVVVLGVLIAACGDDADDDAQERTATMAATSTASDSTPSATASTSGNRVVTDAPIDEVEILVLESFPVQYSARIVSGLPSGCAQFEAAEITGRTDSEVTIRVTNTVPADKTVACTAIYGTKETTVPLGTDFTSGKTYMVRVNDETATFTAQ
jgi:inhibitor of cysteine peptidase